MQTLKRRTSPCKYKNDPSRFLGEGITFKAKLIGILEVSEARGDKMCQDALNDLKTAIRAAGEHKQRITINISIDGLRLRDEKTGDCLYHHPVHKISFIAQDMSDSRAFGYIFGSPDTGHRFFGIKTDKTASQVVISMRDLFQVVFELKKKEIEMAKHHSEQHHVKYGSTGCMDSIHFSKDENDFDKNKGKYSQLVKSRCLTSKSSESGSSDFKGHVSEAIADLLDLEQGINQMDKITSSDPFGPLPKGDSYDPFDDSFPSSKIDKPSEEKVSSGAITEHPSEDSSDIERHSSFFGSTTSTGKTNFFSPFSPGVGKAKLDDSKWFEKEAESLFDESVNSNNLESTGSPIALNTSAPDGEQVEAKRSPIKTDLFTELDPLGTGRVKPYIDKKDFFQELKNPPKKVLKEMISDGTSSDVSSIFFSAHFKDEKTADSSKPDTFANALDSIQDMKNSSSGQKYFRVDPFNGGDPFEKTDPFQEENFPSSIGFAPLFDVKSSLDGIFDEKTPWKFEKPKESHEENSKKNSPTNFSLFSSGILRVSLPPEKPETEPFVATSKLKSSPNSPEDSKTSRRKCYQTLQQKTLDGGEESPVREEPFVKCKSSGSESQIEITRRSPYKDKFYSTQSPPTGKSEKTSASKTYSSVEILDATTPDPPPRAKTALFSIKPPPLPPKKTSQPVFKPPARPPSLEDHVPHYDYLQRKECSRDEFQLNEELKCVKLKKQFFTGKSSSPSNEQRKQTSDSGFPVLLPPPNRKACIEGSKLMSGKKQEDKTKETAVGDGSVLDIKLTQLDGTGLENLAATLGIPSENIYSMTLQDLTKMLAEKYLNTKNAESENFPNETFEADFDSNFGKPEVNNSNPAYDKYAVFKELMQNENNEEKPTSTVNQSELEGNAEKKEGESVKEVAEPEEDKYEALRQLSLNAQKSEDFSKGTESPKNESIACNANSVQEKLFSNALEADDHLNNDVVGGELQTQPSKRKVEDVENTDWTSKTDWTRSPELDNSTVSQLFPLVDKFSDDKKPHIARDNWATFDKSDFHDAVAKKSSDNYNENENSPFSSDGKEEEREISFGWHRSGCRKKNGKNVPWQDDDESWDDYSPKESLCSDESSRDDRSPESKRDERYEKPPWNMCGRPVKEKMWNEKETIQWSRRDKWTEETEDEFEETWRKQREKTGSCDLERKKYWHGNNCEEYGKRHDWCNNWGEGWQERERYSHCYGNRRKRSESDNEYRKRCDSDASDKECIWTFQKNYPESQNRVGKQKHYHSLVRSFRDCPEHCHESRSKHRKGISQKRPSSASESKRSYEKMSSSGDYSFKGGDQSYSGRRNSDKEEVLRHKHPLKDSRHRSDLGFSRHCVYDRKTSGHHFKSDVRSNRGFNSAQSNAFSSPSKRKESAEGKNHDFRYTEPYNENKYKYGNPEDANHFHFDSEGENFEKQKTSISDQSLQDFPKSPGIRGNQWAATNGKTEGDAFFSAKNSDENFGEFKQESKGSPNKCGVQQGTTTDDFEKGQGRNKNQISKSGRQESASSLLRKSDSINIFSRDKDPFEGDEFFSSVL